MKSILFTFESEETRDQFLQTIDAAASRMLASDDIPDGYTERAKNGQLILDTLGTIRLDPAIKADHERQCGIWVSGEKLKEGSLAELDAMFKQEVVSHSATVDLRELRGGEWTSIRKRAKQING